MPVHPTLPLLEAGADVVGYDPSTAALDGCRDGVELAASAGAVLAAELDVLAPRPRGTIAVKGAEQLRGRRAKASRRRQG